MLNLVKDIIMEFIQCKASMDISSYTYECQYVHEDNSWSNLNITEHLG